jgi:hypothetical protein
MCAKLSSTFRKQSIISYQVLAAYHADEDDVSGDEASVDDDIDELDDGDGSSELSATSSECSQCVPPLLDTCRLSDTNKRLISVRLAERIKMKLLSSKHSDAGSLCSHTSQSTVSTVTSERTVLTTASPDALAKLHEWRNPGKTITIPTCVLSLTCH